MMLSFFFIRPLLIVVTCPACLSIEDISAGKQHLVCVFLLHLRQPVTHFFVSSILSRRLFSQSSSDDTNVLFSPNRVFHRKHLPHGFLSHLRQPVPSSLYHHPFFRYGCLHSRRLTIQMFCFPRREHSNGKLPKGIAVLHVNCDVSKSTCVWISCPASGRRRVSCPVVEFLL